jgi:hypothetical protein
MEKIMSSAAATQLSWVGLSTFALIGASLAAALMVAICLQ